ncbi:MAG TPA: WG repeat-containing protein [Clostridium sp.]|nr:WG repeat-containing protein [Clostridium sp.]
MMKKRIIPLLLAAILLMGMVPTASMAAKPEYTSENEPVYLGTEAEYQTTLDTMFDENGLRKVRVGFYSNNGVLNEKYGLVNKYGNFVVQPIYDEIKLYAFNEDYNYDVEETILPQYFIDGYTQAVRDGKMGLLNTRGEEVIPC